MTNRYKGTRLDEQHLMKYLTKYCQDVQALDERIRFVGIADYAGKLVASFYRRGLVPLMDKKETEQYALQTVFRARTRGGFKPQLGEQRYAVAVYDRLIRTTLSILHPQQESHNMYLLISLDVGCEYPSIIEEKVIPFISASKGILFENTKVISEKYID
jgi:hypothetical protein